MQRKTAVTIMLTRGGIIATYELGKREVTGIHEKPHGVLIYVGQTEIVYPWSVCDRVTFTREPVREGDYAD